MEAANSGGKQRPGRLRWKCHGRQPEPTIQSNAGQFAALIRRPPVTSVSSRASVAGQPLVTKTISARLQKDEAGCPSVSAPPTPERLRIPLPRSGGGQSLAILNRYRFT